MELFMPVHWPLKDYHKKMPLKLIIAGHTLGFLIFSSRHNREDFKTPKPQKISTSSNSLEYV